MTRRIGAPRVSEKRLHAYSTNGSGKTGQKWHSISHEELNALFRSIGWIGRRRVRQTDHKGRPIKYWGGLSGR